MLQMRDSQIVAAAPAAFLFRTSCAVSYKGYKKRLMHAPVRRMNRLNLGGGCGGKSTTT